MDHSRHGLLMLLCCLIPIALIAAISTFGLSLGSLSGILPYAAVLVCPLMMIFMMRGMGHDHSGHQQATDQRVSSPDQLNQPGGTTSGSGGTTGSANRSGGCH